jgi:hypothetical protein
MNLSKRLTPLRLPAASRKLFDPIAFKRGLEVPWTPTLTSTSDSHKEELRQNKDF